MEKRADKSTFCVIIGDMKKSRQLENRANAQLQFQSAIDAINSDFRSSIRSEFLITWGDEFQGVLESATDSLRLIRAFQRTIAAKVFIPPVDFRFGVGVGPIQTEIKRVARAMDGEAFHRAREALSRSKVGPETIVYDFAGPAAALVNLLVLTADRRYARIRSETLQIRALMDELENQKRVAERLRSTQQRVSRALRSSALKGVDEIESALAAFFAELT
ncbi:MAG: SatD family protein [Bacteroidota bacterium]